MAGSLPPLGEGCHSHGGLSERQVRQIKRLPADIRAQVHALQVWPHLLLSHALGWACQWMSAVSTSLWSVIE